MNVHDDIANPGQNEVEQECETFLAQPPPRMAIPDRLLKAGRHRKGEVIAFSIGLPVSVGGFFMPGIWLAFSLELAVVVSLSVSTATFCILVLVVKRTTAKRRYFLEHGVVLPAVVTWRTPGTIDPDGPVEILNVRFAFELNGAKHKAYQRFANINPKCAERYLSGEVPVRLLVDPLDVTNILWVEGTLMAPPKPWGSLTHNLEYKGD